jgi:hypothetical protein
MTGGVLALSAAYAALGVLLLSLNLRAEWPWPVKAGAIAVTGGFMVGGFIAVQAMLGWPTERTPPAEFRLHAALVEEPDPRQRRRGTIYLWLSEVDSERGGAEGEPRAHALPYSRSLHEAVAEAQRGLEEGRDVRGRRHHGSARDNAPRWASPGLELYTTDIEGLPPKGGAG